jgi:hypothetical protein
LHVSEGRARESDDRGEPDHSVGAGFGVETGEGRHDPGLDRLTRLEARYDRIAQRPS